MLNLSDKRMIALEKPVWREKKNKIDLVQKFGLRRLQRFDVIQAESPFLLNQEEDKRRVCS